MYLLKHKGSKNVEEATFGASGKLLPDLVSIYLVIWRKRLCNSWMWQWLRKKPDTDSKLPSNK